MTLLDYKDYRAYLKARVAENKGFRGYQSHLAQAAGCQRSFLSQVLSGHHDLTRDHAAEIAGFWNLSALETDYFITLVDLARAGTMTLKRIVNDKLEALREKKSDINVQLKKSSITDVEAQATYYSSWYWCAIHILVSVPGFQSAQVIAERLHLPLELVKNVLLRLEAIGLVVREGNRWSMGRRDIHLGDSSTMTEVNHGHWRTRALIDVQKKEKGAIHYTSVFAVAKADAELIREMVMQTIVKMREAIIPSPEEDLFCFTCDFFRP